MLHVVSPTFYQGWSVMCNDPPLDYEMWLLNTDTVHAAPDFDSWSLKLLVMTQLCAKQRSIMLM